MGMTFKLKTLTLSLLISALLVLWAGAPVGQTYALLFKGAFGSVFALSETFTRAIPLGRIGQPDDLPGAILFFASADAAFVTGQVLSVSGGLTMNG